MLALRSREAGRPRHMFEIQRMGRGLAFPLRGKTCVALLRKRPALHLLALLLRCIFPRCSKKNPQGRPGGRIRLGWRAKSPEGLARGWSLSWDEVQSLGEPCGWTWRARDWDANRRKAGWELDYRALGCSVGQEGKLRLIAEAGFGMGNVGHRFGFRKRGGRLSASLISLVLVPRQSPRRQG